jgi:ferredoxin--NADP+ reductase
VSIDTHPAPVQLQEVVVNRATPKEPVVGRVVGTRLCTAGRKAAAFVRHVEIDVSDTPLAGAFRAGQSFGVVPPGKDATGKPHRVRLYSLSSPTRGEDGQGNVISTSVKRVIDEDWKTHKLFVGLCSNYLADLDVGDEVQVTGPNGKRFVLPTNPRDYNYLFFATGTGIAPFRGMTHDLIEAGCGNQIVLIAGSPYTTDLIYHDEFLNLAAQHKNLRYFTAISRERQSDGHDRMYVDGRMHTERDELIPLLARPNTLIYICGLSGMEVGIYRQLATHLTGSDLARYLEVDGATLANLLAWDRKTIASKVRKTDRVFTEVYD